MAEDNTSTERIGEFDVHPMAAVFPLLEGDEFENLKLDIERHGLRVPLLLQGDVLLDGRNRYRACLDLGIEPLVEQYVGDTPVQMIYSLNIARRHLNDDQQFQYDALLFEPMRAERDALEKQRIHEAQVAGGKKGGQVGGRGNKRSETNSSPTFSDKPKTAAKDARSTVGQFAAKTGASHHKAAQALAVAKQPDLATAVLKGTVKLKDAAKQARERTSPAKPRAKRVHSFLDDSTRWRGATRKLLLKYPRRREAVDAIYRDVRKETKEA